MCLICGKEVAGMASGKHDIQVSDVQKEVSDLTPAELAMVADYIRGMKLARNFRK